MAQWQVEGSTSGQQEEFRGRKTTESGMRKRKVREGQDRDVNRDGETRSFRVRVIVKKGDDRGKSGKRDRRAVT